jgi:hypothetical protein
MASGVADTEKAVVSKPCGSPRAAKNQGKALGVEGTDGQEGLHFIQDRGR